MEMFITGPVRTAIVGKEVLSLRNREIALTNTILAINELSNVSAWTSRGR